MKKNLIFSFIGILIASFVSYVIAETYISADRVSFENNKTIKTNVDDALDELYENVDALDKADATADQILEGKKVAVGRKLVTGTMPNKGFLNETITSNSVFNLDEGYYSGGSINVDVPDNQTYMVLVYQNPDISLPQKGTLEIPFDTSPQDTDRTFIVRTVFKDNLYGIYDNIVYRDTTSTKDLEQEVLSWYVNVTYKRKISITNNKFFTIKGEPIGNGNSTIIYQIYVLRNFPSFFIRPNHGTSHGDCNGNICADKNLAD